MEITEEERGWALAIKDALTTENPELAAKVSDMEYAHHAIIAKEKVPKALVRIKRLEAFRQQHSISTEVTAEDALLIIQKFEALSPGMFLSFGKNTGTANENSLLAGTYMSTWKYSQFLPANYEQPDDWKNVFAAFYYLFDAMQPDLEAVRAGIVMLCDTKGLGWKNFSLEMEKRAAHLYQDAYPVRIQNMTMFHTPKVFRAMYALCKPFLSKKVKDVIVMNATLEEIQEKFPKSCLGKSQGGTQTTSEMEQEMLKGLKLRFANMHSFKLEEAKIMKTPKTSTTTPTTSSITDDVTDKVDT